MRAIAFDTLAYAKKRKASGFTEQQTEVQAEAMAELVNEQLATKRDLKELEMSLVGRVCTAYLIRQKVRNAYPTAELSISIKRCVVFIENSADN